MAFASACERPTVEEFFSDVERRAAPVSPYKHSEATRSPVEPARRLRPCISAWAPQRRKAAISTLSQQPSATHSIRLRDSQARRQSGDPQQGQAPSARDSAADVARGGVRRGDLGASGGSKRELRGAENGADDTNEARTPASNRRIASKGALALIRSYQRFVSPSLGNVCRYAPSCSQYAYEAIDRHGLLKGGWLAFKRLLRCRPWGGRGYDPVPD